MTTVTPTWARHLADFFPVLTPHSQRCSAIEINLKWAGGKQVIRDTAVAKIVFLETNRSADGCHGYFSRSECFKKPIIFAHNWGGKRTEKLSSGHEKTLLYFLKRKTLVLLWDRLWQSSTTKSLHDRLCDHLAYSIPAMISCRIIQMEGPPKERSSFAS